MIFSIGEALIDLFPEKSDDQYNREAGGTNANVASCVAKLGGKASLITKLGSDENGKMIFRTLKKIGVDTTRIFFDNDHPTGVINVSPTIDGTDLCALRKNYADMFLCEKDIDDNWFTSNDILHFCSLGLVESKTKYAHKKCINAIIKAGGKVSFDVNLRPRQWGSKAEYRKEVFEVLDYVDYLKISEEDFQRLFDKNYTLKDIQNMFAVYPNLQFIIVTFADKGVDFLNKDGYHITLPAYKSLTIDATGAGDCFIGCVLYHLDNTQNHSIEVMKEILLFACAASALMVGNRGAISSMPSKDAVLDFIADIIR